MTSFGRNDITQPNSSHDTDKPTYNNSNFCHTFRIGLLQPANISRSHSVMYTRDWRSALRTPPTYRIGNRTVRIYYHISLLIVCAIILCFLLLYARSAQSYSDAAWFRNHSGSISTQRSYDSSALPNGDIAIYNTKYPLTPPIFTHGNKVTYRIGIVADLDTKSKMVNKDGSTTWRSYFKKGYLTYHEAKNKITIKWDNGDPVKLESSFSLKDRGMELSELVTFNGKLLSFDDRTGLVYELINDKAIPWVILLDGDGQNSKGFKAEWATVKGQQLYVGSMGKEWTTGAGDFENENPMYVKVVSTKGDVRSLNWAFNYKYLRQEAMQISWPGYMIHESASWSEHHKKWFFLPRRCSREKYNETHDEYMGCNLLISADEHFTNINTVHLDDSNPMPTHGFSSYKFMPHSDDRIIIAIKSEELDGKTSTFITAFDIEGKTILPEQRIDTDLKYEGIEFI